MSNSLSLVGTAITLGIVHVLTGPDHLCALATLSASQRAWASWWLGIQWGIGHSTGLLVVGGILIATVSTSSTSSSSSSSPEDSTIQVPLSLTNVLEILVGVFMIGLGLYGIVMAILRNRKKINNNNDDEDDHAEDAPLTMRASDENHDPVAIYNNDHDDDDDKVNKDVAVLMLEDIESPPSPPPSFVDESSCTSSSISATDVVEPRSENNGVATTTAFHMDENPSSLVSTAAAAAAHDESASLNSNNNTTTATSRFHCSTGILALLAGLIHGVAGPGGVLGVIPAVQIRDPLLGTLYLGTFCLTSTLTMGCFAVTYGLVSKRIGDLDLAWEFRIQIMSACLSLIVGVLWLVLSATGKLEDIFG